MKTTQPKNQEGTLRAQKSFIIKNIQKGPLGKRKLLLNKSRTNSGKIILKFPFHPNNSQIMNTEAKRCFATHDEDTILICVYILF